MTVFIGTTGNNTATTDRFVLNGFTSGVVFGNIDDQLLVDLNGDIFYADLGNDRIVAGSGNDVILGGGGNDFIDGSGGNDFMDGGTGIDTMRYTGAAGYDWNMVTGKTSLWLSGEYAYNFENAITGSGADRITGTAGANLIQTNGGNDSVNAGAGNDTLYGGLGNDTLRGGTGNDVFVFNTALNSATNTDRLSDFNPANDTIHLQDTVFTALTEGFLAFGQFRVGAVALSPLDRILYNPLTGDLSYDANGSAAGASVRFAHVNPGTAITIADFLVV